MGLVLESAASACGNDRSCFVWKGYGQYCGPSGSTGCISPVPRVLRKWGFTSTADQRVHRQPSGMTSCRLHETLKLLFKFKVNVVQYVQCSPNYAFSPHLLPGTANMWQFSSHRHVQMLQMLWMRLCFASPRVWLWHPAARGFDCFGRTFATSFSEGGVKMRFLAFQYPSKPSKLLASRGIRGVLDFDGLAEGTIMAIMMINSSGNSMNFHIVDSQFC